MLQAWTRHIVRLQNWTPVFSHNSSWWKVLDTMHASRACDEKKAPWSTTVGALFFNPYISPLEVNLCPHPRI